MNKKVILFDLDGTLINTDMLIIRSYMHLFDTYRPDYPLTMQELISFLGPVLKDVFPRYFKEDFDTLLKTYHGYSKANISRFVSLYDDVIFMLESFKNAGIKMGIVTNRFKYSVDDVTSPFDINKYFDVFIALDDMTNPKPHPEGINLAIERLGVNKEDVIFVGDNKSDYLAAKASGVKTALISWTIGRDNSLLNPDILINSYKEFTKEILND